MTLSRFKSLLAEFGVPIFHFEARKCEGKHIIWHEYGTKYLVGGGGDVWKKIQIDFYTPDEYDELSEIIFERLLLEDEICVADPIDRFDDDTELFRTIIQIEVSLQWRVLIAQG